MRHSTLSLLAVAAALGVAATPALAQDSNAPPAAPDSIDPAAANGGDSITVGIGAGYVTDYEGSNDYRVVPAPAAIGSVHGFAFALVGNRLSVDLIPNPPGPTFDIQAGPLVVVDFNRSSTKSIDDDRVKALGKAGTAIELGGYVGIGKTGVITSPYDKLSVSVSYRLDVNSVHKSDIWQPSINYLTPLSRKAAVGLFGSLEHAGQGYADAYFSVTPLGSLASGLPTYNAHRGWKNYTVGALATVSLTGDLLHGIKLVAGGTYKRMLNDFGDSPLVSIAGSRNQWLGAVGLAYTF